MFLGHGIWLPGEGEKARQKPQCLARPCLVTCSHFCQVCWQHRTTLMKYWNILYKDVNTRRWGSLRAMLEVGCHNLFSGPLWFVLLPHAKCIHFLPRFVKVSFHYSITLKFRISLYKSSSGIYETY